MPELPEVEVVRAGLEPAVSGALITGVEVFDTRSLKRHSPLEGRFESLLEGRRMLAAVRRGKFLWFPLSAGAAAAPTGEGGAGGAAPATAAASGPQALVAHLGMSGQVLLRTPGTGEEGLLRIRLQIEHPEHGEFWVNFVDQRIFGSMAVDRLVPTADGAAGGYSGFDSGRMLGDTLALVPGQVAHIARDPLDPAFDEATFLAALGRKRTGIKRALLDQTLVSGIGNIYADESLWAARVHYEHPADRLPRARARELLAEVRVVLEKALAEGGTSFDAQYVNVNGASGYFSHSLNAYGQQGKPCPRCGTPIVREAFMNRSSHLCPRCQRPFRARVARVAA
ncbi:bifunctional DNA-formamidopyrimidine glycosylase/DNA-(apurinic or apyrimidinic site) lyase [Herbiconiux sp. CPCC 205716]|uniref:Bifunctional DNA-formamidopyrimidine glycosylase/DNA-(Apurinic or apyrimidinic site) lyase n=1 Tax=Herbiconiux gentiana TaxID=2970912 RepID=A0ABT2GKD2_9MICO|nr:bifunctional DNA-formamidopyrimidine glycosylase/DNA-(apurinic or apyrimidinic site) lyase [Herbiconiux gentiana]MCS5715384.1 bifunctional DNA-formamidopyrimidine glycosylase/DNA-(apurinic or apyrimidinic site) lyase [Herbiconiux gentiana]